MQVPAVKPPTDPVDDPHDTGSDDSLWIYVNRVRNLHELDDIKTTLPAFVLRDKGLRLLEPFCNLLLSQSGHSPSLNQHLTEPTAFRCEEGSRH